MRVEYLATFALLNKFYLVVRQYVQSLGQRGLATTGAEFTVPVDSVGTLDDANSGRFSIRCTAGKGVKRLRHSVGYLQISDESLVFVTKRMFRQRDHHIERSAIEDIRFNKRLLFDRLIIQADGKQQQFYVFKDITNCGHRAYEILQGHKQHRSA
jgi:hypothetical protein